MNGRVHVVAEKSTSLNYIIGPPHNLVPALNPRFIGINGELSTVPVPLFGRQESNGLCWR